MTNLGFGRFCEANGLQFVATKVGDRLRAGRDAAGRTTPWAASRAGHVIFRDFATTGDGQLTAIQLLSILMRRKQAKLSDAGADHDPVPAGDGKSFISRMKGKLQFYTSPAQVKAAMEAAKTRSWATSGRIVVRV